MKQNPDLYAVAVTVIAHPDTFYVTPYGPTRFEYINTLFCPDSLGYGAEEVKSLLFLNNIEMPYKVETIEGLENLSLEDFIMFIHRDFRTTLLNRGGKTRYNNVFLLYIGKKNSTYETVFNSAMERLHSKAIGTSSLAELQKFVTAL